jgi:hypothetical protein
MCGDGETAGVVETGGNECGEKLVIWGDWGATWGWLNWVCRCEAGWGCAGGVLGWDCAGRGWAVVFGKPDQATKCKRSSLNLVLELGLGQG